MSSSVAIAAFTKGPGTSIMLRANNPTMARTKYCPSYMVHLWACNDLSVSDGDRDVWREDNDDAGDCLVLSFERSFRRNLCGTSICNDRHGSETLGLESVASLHEGRGDCITTAALTVRSESGREAEAKI